MTRIFLRTLNPLTLLILAAFLFAIQTSFFGWFSLRHFQPEMLWILVIWLGLRREFTEGGILTLLFAEIAESFSAATRGTLLLVSILLYLGVRMADKALVIPSVGIVSSSDEARQPRLWFGRFVLGHMADGILFALACVLSAKLGLIALMASLGVTPDAVWYQILTSPSTAIVTAVVSHWAFIGLDQVDLLTFRQTRPELLDPNSSPSREVTSEQGSIRVNEADLSQRTFDL